MTIKEAVKETYTRLENGDRWMVWQDGEWFVLERSPEARENTVLYSGTDEEAAKEDNMKHVPGPYKATRAMHDGQEQRYWWIDDGHESEPFGNLATVWQGFGREPGQVEATARLFESAPDLLAVCKKAWEDLETWHSEVNSSTHPIQGHQVFHQCDGCETCNVTLPLLMTAIAKATGGQDDE